MLCTSFQTLMSVLRALISVAIAVTTPLAPTLAAVGLDTGWVLMDSLVLVTLLSCITLYYIAGCES